jgi:predicted nucleotidyltransferase
MSQMPPIGSFETIRNKALDISIYGYPCKIISLDDLITIKQSMNRPKDQEGLRRLLKIRDLKKK